MTDGSVALVHDYLNQPGGAERVVVELTKLWPEAPLYTTLYRPGSTFAHFKQVDVRTTWLDRVPLDRQFRLLLPFLPAAIHSLGELDYDLVISSSSGWAHGVRTSPRAFHVVYCHNPARWLYESQRYTRSAAQRVALAPLAAGLRRWDWRAAHRPDLFVVNSRNVQRKVANTYGIDAEVVYPPVDVDRFRPSPRGERLLVVSRLLAYKRVDLAVAAATLGGLPLDVVGTGPALPYLKAMAGPSVRFLGRLSDAETTGLMQSCRTVVFPGEEDFGITPVEAMAAGKPVVAFAAGGALETLIDGISGVFFREPTPEALHRALLAADELTTSPEELAARARRFSAHAFAEALAAAIESRNPAASRGLARAAVS